MAYRELLGIQIEHEEVGVARISLTVSASHLNDAGVVHGGVISTLVDVAIGRSIKSVVGETSSIATSTLNISFLSRCRAEKIYAEGRVMKHGRTLIYGDASVFDDHTLVAHGTGTWYVRGGKPQHPERAK